MNEPEFKCKAFILKRLSCTRKSDSSPSARASSSSPPPASSPPSPPRWSGPPATGSPASPRPPPEEPAESPKRRREEGLPMIPLYYEDLAVHHQCRDKNVVYKGMHPKRSQIFFKTLGDVDWGCRERKQQVIREVTFDSRLQSGNLQYAVKLGETEYALYLRVDTNTAGHKMWFYFKVSNRKPLRLKLHLLRFPKHRSLYQRGLRPFVFSRRNFLATGQEWEQQGENVVYAEDDSPFLERQSFKLTFEYEFKHECDEVYFATQPPYTYSMMTKFLKGLPVKVEQLGKSLGGLSIPWFTLPPEPVSKRFILVTARIHPGETSSSFVLQGLVKELLLSKHAGLLDQYTFVVVPMTNPDGVFVGNYRTGLLGLDLNRQFNTCDGQLLPEVALLKGLVDRLAKEGKVEFYFDLHGHSTRKDMFAFFSHWENSLRFYKVKLLLHEVSRESPHFHLDRCVFSDCKEKEHTARVFFSNKYSIKAITFETTFGLVQSGRKATPIGPKQWQNFGKHLVEGLSSYSAVMQALPRPRDQLLETIRKTYFPEDRVIEKAAKKEEAKEPMTPIWEKPLFFTKARVKSEQPKRPSVRDEDYNSAAESSSNDAESQQEDLAAEQTAKLREEIVANNPRLQKREQSRVRERAEKDKVKIVNELKLANVNIINIQEELPQLSNLRSNRRYAIVSKVKLENKSRRRKSSFKETEFRLNLPSLLAKKLSLSNRK